MQAAPNPAPTADFSQLQGENRRLRETVSQLQVDLHDMQALLRYFQRLPFSPSSERDSPNQPLLIQDTPETTPESKAAANEDSTDVKGHKRKKKRPTIPPDAPREVRVHDIPDAEKFCPEHGVPLEKDGERVTEKVEFIPAHIRVIQDVCLTYGCPVCDKTVKAAEPPPSPIPGSIATPSLLAHIATAKFADGLPLYRQEKILQRYGLDLTRTTMATWMGHLGTLLAPLYNLFADTMVLGPVLYIDETTHQVLKTDKKPTSKSYMWIRVGGVDGQKVVLFHFSTTRSGSVAKDLLEGFKGHVMTDGYDGYNIIEGMDGIIRMQCWMHARRYYKKAVKVLGKAGKGGIADQALAKIRALYAIERDCAEMTAEERHQVRLDRSKPLLDAFRPWLEAAMKDVPPQSVTGKAINYTLVRWDQLVIYLAAGHLKMDNGPAENAIRPFAVGRNSWLFSDTIGGAEASAVLYSIIETAKANGKEPLAYLTRVIEHLPQAKTLADIEALLPWTKAPPIKGSS